MTHIAGLIIFALSAYLSFKISNYLFFLKKQHPEEEISWLMLWCVVLILVIYLLARIGQCIGLLMIAFPINKLQILFN